MDEESTEGSLEEALNFNIFCTCKCNHFTKSKKINRSSLHLHLFFPVFTLHCSALVYQILHIFKIFSSVLSIHSKLIVP